MYNDDTPSAPLNRRLPWEVRLMNQDVLFANDRKEQLSYACLAALSSIAGYTCEEGPRLDRWKVDAALRSGDYQIDIQLKATSSVYQRHDGLHYRLDRATYDRLRSDSRPTPIILVILELPGDSSRWLECTPESLIVRRRLWWEWLAGYPEIDTGSRVIIIPETQWLSPASLRRLMNQTRQGLSLKEQ